ncbi:ABC transporter permease [Burkholderia vietnamiensis]|uniref:ABC transporter permease n=1 Tax=Burkholderia vietnamiensis TaxID=60552 RepID=UPI001D14761C|nr:ABC transporter permease [Burkholderia vietnamiensis]UEC03968.1 ABC transporter permease [Burkholderia vietnamiensis]
MTTSADIRALFVSALKGATDAEQAVFSPFDWPTAPDAYPSILVHARKERKESLGRNVPQFNVTATLEIIARTKSPALVGDAGSAVALAAAEKLKAQIESALINNPAIWADPAGGQRIQQFSSVDSELTTSSEGEMPIAELLMTIDVEFFQTADDFFPIPLAPLHGVDLTIQEPDGTTQPGLTINF